MAWLGEHRWVAGAELGLRGEAGAETGENGGAGQRRSRAAAGRDE